MAGGTGAAAGGLGAPAGWYAAYGPEYEAPPPYAPTPPDVCWYELSMGWYCVRVTLEGYAVAVIAEAAVRDAFVELTCGAYTFAP